jgi:transcriptional regulator with XRE-family HTH domain
VGTAVTPESFGRAVRREREKQGLSQEALGALAGLDRTYVSGLERGVRNPTLTTMAKLANALGVALSSLVCPAEADR